MLRKLTHDKQVFEEDLYAYIPAETSSIFQINKKKNVKLFSSYFQEIEPVLLSISPYITYPLLITSCNNYSCIVAKVTVEQEQAIGKLLSKVLYPAFPPKERVYKGTRILFYPGADNKFFTCMFYNGIFVGGYNYEFLERIVDISDSSDLFLDSSFKSLDKDLKINYPVNLIFKENGDSFIFNGGFDNHGNLEFSGLSNTKYEQESLNADSLTDSIFVDKSILPDSLLSYSIDFTRSGLSDKLKSYFEDPLYKLEVDTLQKASVFLLKNKVDRFEIFKELNTLELGYVGKRLSTKDIILNKQHLYTTSEQLATFLFKENKPVTLTFYDGYMFYSCDRDALERYLKKREKVSRITSSNDNDSIFKTRLKIKTIFRSNNPDESRELPFRTHFSKFSVCFSKIAVNTYYSESGQSKTEIILNN